MKVSVNVRYMFVQGMYWTIFCVAMGFVSLYLLGEGVSNSGIGITNAVFAVLSALLQPVLGRICDRNENISWKKMILICMAVFIAVYIVMFFVTGVSFFSAVLVGTIVMVANLIMPFINSALFYYEKSGEYINFGVARGIGSGMYAIAALIIGNIAAVYGTKVVPVAGVLCGILFVLAVVCLPYNKELDNSAKYNKNKSDSSEDSDSNESFIKKYPVFLIMLIGFILLLATHNILCNFLLQIIQNVGGDSSNLGTALAIQAALEVPVLFCFGLLLKHFSANALMGVAAVGFLSKTICYYVANSVPAMYLIQITQIFSFAVFASASVYYTGAVIKEKDRTTGQALMASCIVCGNFIGSIVGGPIIDLFGVKTLLIVNIFIAVVGVCVALAAVFMGRKTSRND